MRRKTWNPIQPNDLFRFIQDERTRWVQSSNELLDAVVESLRSLQSKLHGEHSEAQFLWDGQRPKEERALSDWIVARLKENLVQRGIILGREVQIHLVEKTDIHVDAVSTEPETKQQEQLKVIVEVKGCWNRDVRTAIKTQLTERYLRQNDCQNGVYLVVWFNPVRWDKQDRRRTQVRFKNAGGLLKFLEEQAKLLSTSSVQVRGAILDASLSVMERRPKQKKGKRDKGQAGRRRV
jgi:hypothetical protein